MFSHLKYNLYEILNVSNTSNSNIIRKQYLKLIKNFHPDKNSSIEMNIYYHIIEAKNILLDEDIRKLYDNFIDPTIETFDELKTNYKNYNNISNITLSEAKQEFNNKLDELEKKHNIHNININQDITKIKYNNDIIIDKEDIKDSKEFNNKFDNNKLTGLVKTQIIELSNINNAYDTLLVDNYSNIEDIDKLYVEDSIDNNLFSSLDRAFVLQPLLTNK
uniref:J domain-containing protein n=1 Tax=viral metagenome TaxID=1070528 RepID=A0A6C0H8F0_9ZZZZ